MAVLSGNTNCTITGTDIGFNPGFVTRDYLINVYPSLFATFKQSGLWTWGINYVGQLGNNSTTNRSSPVQTVSGGTNWKQQSGGRDLCGAIKTDGTLWMWGSNYCGALGNNATTPRSSPVQTVSGGTNWTEVSLNNHSSAIKTDGTLWTWGYNYHGQLGTNTMVHRSSPVQTVSTGSNWKQVSCGSFHTASIKTDGTLWMWGQNIYGQLGDNTANSKSSPVQTVSGGTNWKQVSSGSNYTAAIKTDGTLWSWGSNYGGELGDNTTTSKSSPVQTISTGTNWSLISCYAHTAAIKTDGTLWVWGNNYRGQLGTNTLVHKSSPVQTVASGTNWKQVSCNVNSTVAIKTDGSLWTVGRGVYGQLGDNTIADRSSPVQTVAGGTNWKLVSSGYYFVTAIRDDSADIFGDPL